MIKKSIFENELIENMNKELLSNDQSRAADRLSEALDCLYSASEILDETGLIVQSNKIINLLSKIAENKKPRDPRTISDPSIRNLNPNKMVKNLLHHGTEFNMADDEELISLDIDGLEGLEEEDITDFEDEI